MVRVTHERETELKTHEPYIVSLHRHDINVDACIDL